MIMDLILTLGFCLLVALAIVQNKRISYLEKKLFVDENFE